MSTENPDENVEVLDSSTDTTQDANAVESSTTEGAGEQGSPTPEPAQKVATEKSARESLIAQLTGEEDEVSDDEEDETADEPAVDPAATDKVEATPDPKAAPAVEPDPTTAGAPEDEDETLPEGTKGKAAKRWKALIEERKALRVERDSMKDDAAYGKSLMAVAQEAKMPPQAFGAWIALGAEVHAEGPQNLPLRLFAEAKKLAAHFNVQLPVDRVVEKPAFDLDAFEEKLVDDIAEMAIDPAIGKKYLAEIRAAKKKTSTTQQQAPAPQAPAAVVPPPRQEYVQPPAGTPTQTVQDPDRDAAVAELDRLQTEYAAAMPADWQKIRPRVVTAMAAYKGTSPKNWARFFKQEVENAKRSLGARKPVIPTTTRPSTTSQTTPSKPKSGRAEILEELT